MRIRELYRKGVLASVDVGESLLEAAEKMIGSEVGALAVMRDGRLVGIISEQDLATSMSDGVHPAMTRVRDYMTPSPMTVEPDDEAEVAVERMLEAGVRHMPVTHGIELVGMVSLRDLVVLAVWPESHPV